VPSPLLAALPFVFLTDDLHVVTSTDLQGSQLPANVQITKYFSKSQVNEIKAEFFEVQAMGPGTAEEWVKGLDSRGKAKRNDAAKWERWEQTSGVQRIRSEAAAATVTTSVTGLTQTSAVNALSFTKPLTNPGLPTAAAAGLPPRPIGNGLPPASQGRYPIISTTYSPTSGIPAHSGALFSQFRKSTWL
jgi:hypothetical protein